MGASMTEFIRTELTTTTRDAARSENLKRFARFHPMEDDPLHDQKMPLYRKHLRMGIKNSKDSDTDSRSGEPPLDDASESKDSWPSTSEPGEEELEGPTASLPGFVGGTADGLATQPDATTKTAGDQVPSLPLLQIDAPSLVDKNMMNLFGDDDKLIENNDEGETEGATSLANVVPCTITARCTFFPFTYEVVMNGGCTSLTAAQVLIKVKEKDESFEPEKFDLGYNSRDSTTLSIMKPSSLLADHGFINPTTITLVIARKQRPPSKLKSKHKCRVLKCPGHLNEGGHVVCSNEGCKKMVTKQCYLASLVPRYQLKEQPGKLYCTKACYIAGNKKDNTPIIAWEKDGKNGTDDPNNSMALLIQWVVEPGNLAKWRGGCY